MAHGTGARLTRRQFGGLTGGALLSIVSGQACASGHEAPPLGRQSPPQDASRITARPRPGITTTARGEHALGLSPDRDAILQMPSKPAPGPIPLLVLLHGAGSSGAVQVKRLGSTGDANGVAILAPDSRGGTWDAIRMDYGPDVVFLNRALQHVFEIVDVDPARLTLGGFSDGASYALSLGLANGDVFPRILACSPGFVIPGPEQGKPHVFVSHGRSDDILPIDRCSRRIVPALRERGYDVTFREFDGGHEIPPVIAGEALTWVAAPATQPQAPAR